MTSKMIYFGTRYCMMFHNHILCPEASNICESHSDQQSRVWREWYSTYFKDMPLSSTMEAEIWNGWKAKMPLMSMTAEFKISL